MWERNGLLYTSGELEEEEKKEYEIHLQQCDRCREELQRYTKLKENWFTPEILGENSPEHVDKEILRVCARPRQSITTTPLFGAVMKKSIIALFLLVVGMGGGSYFAYHIRNAAEEDNPVVSHPAIEGKNVIQEASIRDEGDDIVARNDSNSVHDSLKSGTQQPFSKHQGNASLEGVITVDTQK
jgi:hypothetical protein